MWRESYTKVMERGVQDVFAACGIDFVGRNHAMGSTQSAPEIAICSKEIFGMDIDVLLWDTAMSEGRDYWRMLMYFLRAGTLAQQPAIVGYNLGQGQGPSKQQKILVFQPFCWTTWKTELSTMQFQILLDCPTRRLPRCRNFCRISNAREGLKRATRAAVNRNGI
jgi:hypothetical protein